MSEGYRAAPWFQEMARRGDLGIADCAKCKMKTSQLERKYKGCGYEPRHEKPPSELTIWQPPTSTDGKTGYTGPRLTICAGYTANLPQVVEAYIARAHWLKGNVPMHVTPEALLTAILIVNSQHDAMEARRLEESKA